MWPHAAHRQAYAAGLTRPEFNDKKRQRLWREEGLHVRSADDAKDWARCCALDVRLPLSPRILTWLRRPTCNWEAAHEPRWGAAGTGETRESGTVSRVHASEYAAPALHRWRYLETRMPRPVGSVGGLLQGGSVLPDVVLEQQSADGEQHRDDAQDRQVVLSERQADAGQGGG